MKELTDKTLIATFLQNNIGAPVNFFGKDTPFRTLGTVQPSSVGSTDIGIRVGVEWFSVHTIEKIYVNPETEKKTLQKRFSLNEVLDSMPTPPHTVEISQYKRGLGDIALTYKAKFKIKGAIASFGMLIESIAVDLIERGIKTKRADVEWIHAKNFAEFLEKDNQEFEATVSFELITPDVQARRDSDDENFLESAREYFKDKFNGEPVDGSVDE